MRVLIASCAIASALASLPAAGGEWTYREQQDKMGRGTIKYAEIESSNQVSFGFPYGGPQRAELTLRKNHRGTNVLLTVPRSQFLCRFDGCNVLVRFDDKKPERYSASEPADHSSNVIFINNEARFVQSLRNAKTLRIEAQFYQQGNRVLEFDVAGLQWDGVKSKKADTSR